MTKSRTIDRISRSMGQDFVVHDHEGGGKHGNDGGVIRRIDESLAVALAEWQ